MDKLTENQFQILLKEFEILHNRIKDYDVLLFQIKRWSITIFSAIIGLAVINNKVNLLPIALVSTLLFWGIEGLYKKFQAVLISRVGDIEKFFNNEKSSIKIGYIRHSFYSKYSFLGKVNSVLVQMFHFHVYILYLSQVFVLILVSIFFI